MIFSFQSTDVYLSLSQVILPSSFRIGNNRTVLSVRGGGRKRAREREREKEIERMKERKKERKRERERERERDRSFIIREEDKYKTIHKIIYINDVYI